MADLIDSFVISLSLDPKNYNDEIKKYRDDRKRLAEEDSKYNQNAEIAQKRAVEGIKTLRNETIGFLFVLAGANSVKDFALNIISGDAAVGRLAGNLGIATEQASAWEGAIKRVGGTAADIDGALRSMSSSFQSLQLTGTTGHDADFQGLGVTAKDLQNPSDALLKIAEASQRMGKPEFTARLTRIGFDQNTINLLEKGRAGVSALLAEQVKLGVTTDKDAQAAQRFQDQLAKIESAIVGKARPAIEKLVEVVGNWLSTGDHLNTVLIATGSILAAIGIAAAVAYWPFTLLAGAIALVAVNLDKIKAAGSEFAHFWEGLGNKLAVTLGIKTEAQGAAYAKSLDAPTPGGSVGGSDSGTTPGGSGGGYIQKYFQGKGIGAAQARGMVAAMTAENSTLSPNRSNPTSGAYGIGQWLGARKRALFAKYGPNPSLQQQLDFMWSEMQGGDRGATVGVTEIQRAGSSGAAAKAMIDRFYRPGPGAPGDYARAAHALGTPRAGATIAAGASGSGSTNQTTSVGQIVVYSAATDADGIAHDMRGALAKRGLVVQANTGLAQ